MREPIKNGSPKTTLTLAFLASISIGSFGAIPASAETPATSQPIRAYRIGRRGRG